MSAKAARQVPLIRHGVDGHIGGTARASSPGRNASDPSEATLGPVPPPLPSDPNVRAELFARLDRGIAEARAGRVVDWEDLDRRTRAKHRLPSA